MKLKNIVIDLSSCIYCTGPLIKHDKDCLICSACKRKYDIINRQLIINQFDALENRVERDLPPFSPRKGQSNWRALNYSEIFDFFLDQNENKIVVDLGSGPRTNLDILKRFKNLILLDGTRFSGVDIVCNFEERLPLLDESIDLILCSNVLEHMLHPRFIISEMNRVLKPGGKALVLVPFVIKEHQVPFDYFRFTKFSLLKLSEESYFEVNYINGFGGTMNIMRTQLSLFKNSAKSINHLKRILVAMPLIKIFEILIRISKFIVGDLVHHDCPQGYAVALTKKKINC